MTAKVSSWSAVLFSGLVILLLATGCGGGSSSTASNVTATPTFSPGGGTYTATQKVTISDATSGAVLYCTTDGTTPTASSPQCSQPTSVLQSEFLQAIAVAPGKAASAVVSAGYTINLNSAPIPDFSPAGGAYLSTQTVTISDAVAGANIYYTVDGTVPTVSSSLYTTPITVSATQTLKAIAVASNFGNSGVASATYTIGPVVAVPTFSIAGGTYTTPQQVGLGDSTSGATIYYTTDGSTPTTKSKIYTTPIPVSSSITINALATASGYTSSAVASATYVINLAPAPAPTFSLTLASLSISDTAPGVTIYYTTNGSKPTTSSPVYGGPITVTQGEVVQAIAAGANYLNSPASSYVVNFPIAATPTFSLALNQLTIADATTGATIYYTTDGTAPTVASPVYKSPITVTQGEVIKAIAAGPGLVTSPVASSTIAFTATPAPKFSPAGGLTSTVPVAVTLSDVAGTTIYYTTDGSTPTTGSTVYSSPFTVSSTTTVNAIATAAGFANSSVASAIYTIAPGNTKLSGSVMSGAVPVKGAEVQVYAAGQSKQSDYGSNGTALLAQAVTTDDAHGAFNVTFNCPAAPGDLIYLVATGGDSGNGPNSNIALMTTLGSCNNTAQWVSSITVNEVTTVASAYSLAQFMTTAPNVGAPTTNYQGLSNSFATVGNLVDLTLGQARDHTPAYPTNFAGDSNIVNNSTVPQARINTLANALNACTSNSSGCSGLFSATKIGSAEPADTLKAILNIAQNPGKNVSGVYTVASSSAAYTPSFAGAPNDWTLALTFTGGGLGIAPNISGTDSLGSSGVGPNISTSLAIDANGNVFVAGFGEYGYPFITLDLPILAAFNNLGVPQTQQTTVSSDATPLITFGGSSIGQSVGSELGLSSIAIDGNGNIWAGDLSSGSVFTVSPSLPNLPLLASAVVGQSVNSVAIDSENNAWVGGEGFAEYTYETGNASLQEATLNQASNAYGFTRLSDLAFDSTFNLWGYDYTASTIYQITADGSFVYSAFPTRGTGSTQAMSMAADNLGNIYACGDAGGTTLDVFTVGIVTSGNPPTTYQLPSGGRGCGEQLLLDGLGHLFAISNGFGRAGITGATIDEYTTQGVAISPVNGFTGTSSGEQPTITIDSNAPLSLFGFAPTTGAIDGSGNLWLVNADTSNSGGTGNSTGNVLVEFLGIAAPVVTPTSVALKNGQLGARP